jgi:ABC-type antimicrobial peptide transport system permease subunit
MEGVYSPGLFIQGLVTAIFLGLIGGAYPAWWASNLQPVEALRYEGGSAGDDQGKWAPLGRLPVGLPLRNLWRRRMRTAISVSGIGIGVATLVMLGGLTAGLIAELNSLAGSGSTGSISLMQRKVADLSLSTLDERMVSQIQAMSGVKSVSPMLLGFIMTPEMPMFMLAGMDPNSAAMAHYRLVEGRPIARPNEIVIGRMAMDNYKVGLDDVLTLYDNRNKIVGIYETGTAYEDGAGMLALREAQRLLGRPRSVSFIFVDVNKPSEAETVRAALERRFPEAQVSLSSDFAQDSDSMAQMDAMTAAIGLLAMVVGGIVVANTMMMSIYERTREIGTLRALGWRKRRILGQVVQESLLLCLLAGLFGSILGVVLVWLIGRVPAVNSFLTIRWEASVFLQAIGLALAVGLVAGLYPAWRASRMQPVEALRYE